MGENEKKISINEAMEKKIPSNRKKDINWTNQEILNLMEELRKAKLNQEQYKL